jgi:SulP family sulfate permease
MSGLKALGVKFHLSEIKGPVMDRLKTSDFLTHLTGKVFLSQHQAICELAPNPSSNPITTSHSQERTFS